MSERNTVLRSMHDVGLAAWFGGSLMGAVGLNGAAKSHSDSWRDNARIASIGWAKWTPVNAAAIGAHLVGARGLLAVRRRRKDDFAAGQGRPSRIGHGPNGRGVTVRVSRLTPPVPGFTRPRPGFGSRSRTCATYKPAARKEEQVSAAVLHQPLSRMNRPAAAARDATRVFLARATHLRAPVKDESTSREAAVPSRRRNTGPSATSQTSRHWATVGSCGVTRLPGAGFSAVPAP
ncbi:hypothetical protein [Streptomyces sp. NPDC058613]|uniref:hypothetical protein n=1 Tax=unclassified Streptomyces TaxID=2593676 RepID=UPI00364AA0AE